MHYQYVREPLTAEEADRLANACETPTEQLIVWTLLDTGLVGEPCAESHADSATEARLEVKSMRLKLIPLFISSLVLLAPCFSSRGLEMAIAQPPALRRARTAPPPASAELPPDERRMKLSKKIDTLLRDELITHWYPHAINRERGGFHQSMSRDWSLKQDDDVFLVYQARMTWTAAAFAEYSPDNHGEFAKYAHHGIAFLDTVLRDKQFGGFHWVLGRDGKLDTTKGDEKHVYGTSFVVYAGSKTHQVTADPLAKKVACDAFDWLESHAHDHARGGYFEAISRDGRPILAWPSDAPMANRLDRLGVYYGFKSMNSHIHLLEALTELKKIDDRPVVKERLRELLEIVRDRIAVEPGALNLYLTPDWRPVPAHDSFGHDVETAFLLVEAATTLGSPEDLRTWQMARALIDHALDWGWDEANGGFYDKGESFAAAAFDRKKVWWSAAEGLNALLLMHRKYGDRTGRYWNAFLKQWEFIEKHLLDSVHGGWFAETTPDGKLLGDGAKAHAWKANYHTARAMMNVARMLRE
jgi:mannobiose 2-epimerase